MRKLNIKKKFKRAVPFVLAGTMALTGSGCGKNSVINSEKLNKAAVITDTKNNKYIVIETNKNKDNFNIDDRAKTYHWKDLISGNIYHECEEVEERCSDTGCLPLIVEDKEPIILYLESEDIKNKRYENDDFLVELYLRINEEAQAEDEKEKSFSK